MHTFYFVKETGKMIGVDMTTSQLEIANKYLSLMMEKYKFSQPNIEFILKNIQKIDLDDTSVDVVISNCVLNLVPEKRKPFYKSGGCSKKEDNFTFLICIHIEGSVNKIKKIKLYGENYLQGPVY